MSWGRRWPERQPRPKVERLSRERKDRILKTLEQGIASSAVLSALNIRVRALRGRFYFERLWSADDGAAEIEGIGRITPLTTPRNSLLLEAEKSEGNWFEISRGGAKKLVNIIAGDTEGTFHGLGALDKSLRNIEKGLDRLEVKMLKEFQFVYVKSAAKCSVQEALFHFFGLPIEVIAEPREWYWYHRRPRIVEVSEDRSRILVNFSAMSMSGSNFGGTCLYAKKEGQWEAFTIKPNQSGDIATAITWLAKRNWRSW